MQNAVGAATYGLYYSVLNLTFMFNILLDFGINNYNNRQVAREGKINAHNFVSLLILRTVLTCFYVFFTVFIAWILGYSGEHWFFLGWLVVNQILVAFIQFFRSNLSGLHLFRRDSIVSVLDRALLIVLFGSLLWWGNTEGPFRIEWFVWGQTAAYIVVCIVAALFCLGKFRLRHWKFRKKDMRALLANSFPFALLTLLMMLYYKIDGVMIERMLVDGAEQAGIYAQAFRLLEAGNIVGFLFAGLLLPMFSRMLKDGERHQVRNLVSSAVRFLIVPSVFVWCICLFYAEELMALLYHAHVGESAYILKWLMGSFVCLSWGFVFGTLVTASGKMKKLNIMAAITLVVNAVLNAFLIPSLKAEGAAIASLASMAVMAVGQIVVAWPLFDGFSAKSALRTVVLLIVSFFLVYILKTFSGLGWTYAIGLSVAGMAILFIAFGGIRKSDFVQFAGASEK